MTSFSLSSGYDAVHICFLPVAYAFAGASTKGYIGVWVMGFLPFQKAFRPKRLQPHVIPEVCMLHCYKFGHASLHKNASSGFNDVVTTIRQEA